MMKLIFSAALQACITLLLSWSATAQNVGIGTTTPDQKLELEGSDDQLLRINTTASGNSIAGLELLRYNEFSGTDWQIVNDGGVLKFLDGIDNFLTPGTENMRITQSGNVGIGTDDPLSRLHISGQGDQLITVQNTTFGGNLSGIDLLRYTEFGGTDWRIVNDGGVLKFLNGTDNFDTAGEENMRITQGGKVGIGETSPESHLHVYGTTQIGPLSGGDLLKVGSATGNYIAFDNNEISARNSSDAPKLLYLQYWGGNLSLCADNDGEVGIGTSNPAAKLHVTDGTDVNYSGGGQLVLGPTNGLNLGFDGNEILARNDGNEAALFLQISGGDVLMTPNENGQVGIGVQSMANMPTDDYLLAVDGKIISEEVRVEMSSSWPDYVFTDDYTLTPLDLLEQEIGELGHLPGIPSASEIEESGFELGEMQRRVLQKVEELTLYTIEANKQIEELRAANESLRQELNALKGRK